MPRQRTILLIDDDRQVLDLLEASLSLKDYRVVSHDDPAAALNYLKNTVPDLIICEVDLQRIDGFQLIHRIRESTRAAYSPFIFIGAEREPEKVARGLRMGAREFLRKPFTVDEMLVRVAKVFDAVANSRTAAPRFDLEGRLEMLPFAP
ncbi:MAG: response regulator, partial [Myxococcota bacterium]|nr:response regulator [Myxococcota bacterium]